MFNLSAMPIANKDQLYQLIFSLTKAEKRNFKLYARRLESNRDPLFIRLFDVLDKPFEPDHATIAKRLNVDTAKLSNIKRHLYSQILKSLRLIHSKRDPSVQIREKIDHSQILYGKGLYLQSLKILDKARSLAQKANNDILLFEILESEKLIESRHITRSRKVKDKVENLIEESLRIKEIVANASDLTNLNLKIHGLYIKKGHVRNEMDVEIARDYFYSNLRWVSRYTSGFNENVSLHQAYMWFYYTCLDFPNCYKHAKKWVDAFEEKTLMKEKDPDLYMRGQHYLLTTLFYMDHKDVFRKYFRKFMDFHEKYAASWNATSQMTFFIYGFNAKINNHFLKGEFDHVCRMKDVIEKQMELFSGSLDKHRQITFYYKLAWSYIAIGKEAVAIDYLNNISMVEQNKLRSEILCYTRILLLIAHHSLGNWQLIKNLVPTVKRYFRKHNEENPVQLLMLDFLKESVNPLGLKKSFSYDAIIDKLESFFIHPYHKKAFIYFNFIDWVRALKNNCTIEHLVANDYSVYLDSKLYK